MKRYLILLLINFNINQEVNIENNKELDDETRNKVNMIANTGCVYLVNHKINANMKEVQNLVQYSKANDQQALFNKIISNYIIYCLKKIDVTKINDVVDALNNNRFDILNKLIDLSEFDIYQFKDIPNVELSETELKVWKMVKEFEKKSNNKKEIEEQTKKQEERYKREEKEEEIKNTNEENNKLNFLKSSFKFFNKLGFQNSFLLIGLFFILIYFITDIIFSNSFGKKLKNN